MNSVDLLYRLWAKTNDFDRRRAEKRGETVPPPQRHPLPCHLIDVAHVAETWLDADRHLLDRFCTLWPSGARDGVRRALVLAAGLHDLGKAYPDFQAKADAGWAAGYGRVWSGRVAPTGTGFDHGAGTGRIVQALFDEDAPLDVDPRWRSLVPLLRVAAGHHGRLYSDAQVAPDDSLAWDPRVSGVVRAALDEMASLFGPPPDLAPPSNDVLMLAAGFVSIADWFGSDTTFFDFAPEVTGPDAARAYLAQLRVSRPALEALRNAGLIVNFGVPGTFEALFSPDGERWTPRAGFQAQACTAPFGCTEGPEMVVVEAPMGLGKTEIALYLSAEALRHQTVQGLYFALPTQATSNALFDRVADFAGRVRGDLDLALTLAHGGKRYFEAYHQLVQETWKPPFARNARSASDRTVPAEVVAPSWTQPSKRALLAPVGLGTIDQAMLGAMGVKHSFVRLFGLARKVVVFDEIHAYDDYMNVLILHLLRWLHALGAKVILLSATLPQGLRHALLDAYDLVEPHTGDPAHTPYPQLLYGRPRETTRRIEDPTPVPNRPRKRVHVEPLEADDRTAAGVRRVVEAVERGGCIAWIRNTVREAQEAWRLLVEAGVDAELLHARFTRHDRNTKEERLLDEIGSPQRLQRAGTERPGRRVVVATQVIEQSVDLDFDLMLSDLAPVDLLLQRAGRLHRHDRPLLQRHHHREPVLVVLMPSAARRALLQFGNSVYVYDADTLARSASLVLASQDAKHQTWTLPDACRTLVADLYDRDAEYWTATRLGCDEDLLAKARARIEKRQRAMQSVAEQARVTPPGMLPVMRVAARDDGENDVGVGLTTRYGGRSAALVLFQSRVEGPIPVGAACPCVVPDEDDYPARLRIEEMVAMATVAFPWYGELPDAAPPESLRTLAQWWKEQHPYDARAFALLREDGTFTLGELAGRYDNSVGLVLERPHGGPQQRTEQETAPFEDL